MHELKEKFRKIFNKTNDWYPGVFKLGMWLSRAKKYFPNSNNTIIRWFDEIIAYFDNGTTSTLASQQCLVCSERFSAQIKD
jgi:transposase